LAGHGAQKLFGVLGGYGPEGTGGWLESLGLAPGKPWAYAAGAGEFGSGLLVALGLLNPIGPIAIFGPMLSAWALAHKGKPIWVSSGGAELPLTNMAIGAALALTGPGRYSLDEALGIKVPTWMAGLAAGGVLAGVAAQMTMASPPPEQQQDEAREQVQAQANAEADQA
jgi:putative oxidoreductase